MRMVPLASLKAMDEFPLTKWGIPEPSVEQALALPDGTTQGRIDLVITPGCAFDARCNRLGHGKGYYDSFFERCFSAAAAQSSERPVTIGVCLDEQIVEAVPTTPHDVQLDYVITPTRIFVQKKS